MRNIFFQVCFIRFIGGFINKKMKHSNTTQTPMRNIFFQVCFIRFIGGFINKKMKHSNTTQTDSCPSVLHT